MDGYRILSETLKRIKKLRSIMILDSVNELHVSGTSVYTDDKKIFRIVYDFLCGSAPFSKCM